MIRFIRSLLRSGRGATAVEFAVVAPIFLMMVMGTIEFGRLMYVKASLQNAVESATRYAIVNTAATTSDVETHAASKLGGKAIDGASFEASNETVGGTDFVVVQGNYTFTFMVPLIPSPPVALAAKSRMPML